MLALGIYRLTPKFFLCKNDEVVWGTALKEFCIHSMDLTLQNSGGERVCNQGSETTDGMAVTNMGKESSVSHETTAPMLSIQTSKYA